MTTDTPNFTSAAELREHLGLLEQERALAVLNGVARDEHYMADLLDELQALRSAYIGAAVTEIASLRAALGSPLLG